MKSQSLAATNRHLRKLVHVVSIELLLGKTCMRSICADEYEISFDTSEGRLFANVRHAKNGGHCGAWEIKLAAV